MLTQGDSVYDVIDKRDHGAVQSELLHGGPSQTEEARSFFCRMNVARSFRRQAGFGDHKMMHVKGHFLQAPVRDHYTTQPVFIALCSPLVTPEVKDAPSYSSTMVYQSVHGLDMKYIEISTT